MVNNKFCSKLPTESVDFLKFNYQIPIELTLYSIKKLIYVVDICIVIGRFRFTNGNSC